jgi:RHH-type proline utilization regulon transcriptional repressor/proline dehydrogenase/delta 1-pyrroline-5-carboxylate dehydrogenase
MQAYQTRALELVAHVTQLARRHGRAPDVPPGQGRVLGCRDQARAGDGPAAYPVFTHKHHTDVSYLACARALLDAPDAIYPQFATHNAGHHCGHPADGGQKRRTV